MRVTACVLSLSLLLSSHWSIPAWGRGPIEGSASTSDTGAKCIGPSFDDTAAIQSALDSGRSVHLDALGGACFVTKPLVFRKPGQLIIGDGRARTKIIVDKTFRGAGVFLAQTGGPGPVWRDFAMVFNQPDTATKAEMYNYPPAFSVRGTPGFQIEHVACFKATICVDMKGNSGNAYISDLQFDAFGTGIDIDGSLDSVRIIDAHWWPFDLTPKQRTVFALQGVGQAIAINAGRVDDLKIRGGLFLGGLALHMYKSDKGLPGGTIDGTDFDTKSGLFIEADSLVISGSTFSLGVNSAQAVRQTGGTLTIGTTRVFVGSAVVAPVIEVDSGSLSLIGDEFESNWFDVSTVSTGNGATVTLVGNRFGRSPGRNYAMPTISLDQNTIATVIGNRIGAKSGGTGRFIRGFRAGSESVFLGNVSPGWQ